MHKFVILSAAQTVGLTSDSFTESQQLAEEMVRDSAEMNPVGIYELRLVGERPPPVTIQWHYSSNGSKPPTKPSHRNPGLPNSFREWSKADEAALRKMFLAGETKAYIASRLGRSLSAIDNRVGRLGLLSPKAEKK